MRVSHKLRIGLFALSLLAVALGVFAHVALRTIGAQQHEITSDTLPLVFDSFGLNRHALLLAVAARKLEEAVSTGAISEHMGNLLQHRDDLRRSANSLNDPLDTMALKDLHAVVDNLTETTDQIDRAVARLTLLGQTIAKSHQELETLSEALLIAAEDAMNAVSLQVDAASVSSGYATQLRPVFLIFLDAERLHVRLTTLRADSSVAHVNATLRFLQMHLASLAQTLLRHDGIIDQTVLRELTVSVADALQDSALVANHRELIRQQGLLDNAVAELDAEVTLLQSMTAEIANLREVSLRSDGQTLLETTHFWSVGLFVLLSILLGTAALISYLLIELGVTRRLALLHTAATSIEAGNYDAPPSVSGTDEIAALGHALDRLRRLAKKRSEIELALHEARRSAEHTATAKSEFLSMMSHEIRTPLNAIIGTFELIERADIPEKQKKRAEMGRLAARQLYALLSKVLDASRLEADGIDVTPEWVSVQDILGVATATAEAALAQSRSPVTFACQSDLGSLTLHTDPLLVQQILSNLIDNAVRFTLEGQITLLAGIENGQTLVLEVRDTGIGVTKEEEAKLFAPFQQIESGMRRKVGGSGLGLSISRGLATLLKGELTFESLSPKGSRFILKLPISGFNIEDRHESLAG